MAALNWQQVQEIIGFDVLHFKLGQSVDVDIRALQWALEFAFRSGFAEGEAKGSAALMEKPSGQMHGPLLTKFDGDHWAFVFAGPQQN